MSDNIEFPATVTVHWPSGPVPACGMHGQQLVNLGNYLGSHVVASPILEPAECVNCRNEAAKNDTLENLEESVQKRSTT